MVTTTAEPRLEWIARTRYGARGIVYVMVGWLALAAAWDTGRAEDTKGALRSLLDEPFGQVLLGIMAIGLVGFAAWRLLQSITDADDHGTDAKGLAVRAGLLASSVTYLLLALFAISLITGWGSGGSGSDSKREWTAQLLAMPFGRWLVAGVGLIVIGVGLAHGYKAYKAGFRRHLDMDAETLERVSPVCRFGLSARGVVFLIIGGFLLLAAVRADPNQTRGLSGALQALQEQPYGWVLLGIVALGLLAFGIYSIIEAVYRRIGARA